MNFPNKIEARDFDDWVQERGLYFWEKWDDKYHTVLSMHDPGEKDLLGSLFGRARAMAFTSTQDFHFPANCRKAMPERFACSSTSSANRGMHIVSRRYRKTSLLAYCSYAEGCLSNVIPCALPLTTFTVILKLVSPFQKGIPLFAWPPGTMRLDDGLCRGEPCFILKLEPRSRNERTLDRESSRLRGVHE